MEEKINVPSIQIEVGEKEAEGIYSNFVMIIHSPSEFILDFAKIMPGIPKAKVQTRIIMTPSHAKMLLKALKDNIEKFEQKFGEIKIYEQEVKKIGFTP